MKGVALALVLVAAALVAGCGGGDSPKTDSASAADAPPSYLQVLEEAAKAKAEGKIPQSIEPGESEGAEGPTGGDCLAFVEGFSAEEIETLLSLAQRQVEAGGSEPDPGTCGAERLEWMREQVE